MNRVLAVIVIAVCWAPSFVKASELDRCVEDLERMSARVWNNIPTVRGTTYADGSPLARVNLYGEPTPRYQEYKDVWSMPRALRTRVSQYQVTQKADQCMAIADREGR